MKLKEMTLEQIFTLYNIACDICREYSRMTDGYVLATGDNVLDPTHHIPNDMQNTINERQQYFSIKDRITTELKTRLLTEIDYE
jgi:uncharacterized membrane protein